MHAIEGIAKMCFVRLYYDRIRTENRPLGNCY